jgi:hypothetical protein
MGTGQHSVMGIRTASKTFLGMSTVAGSSGLFECSKATYGVGCVVLLVATGLLYLYIRKSRNGIE